MVADQPRDLLGTPDGRVWARKQPVRGRAFRDAGSHAHSPSDCQSTGIVTTPAKGG
jgi:hypothetical protein